MGEKARAVLEKIAAKKGWGGKEIRKFKHFAASVAQIESLNNPQAHQSGGGPGRGKFQFEIAAGKGSGGNKVAVNRYKNFVKDNPDFKDVMTEKEWAVLNSEDPDFSLLSGDAQDVMFYVNHYAHPRHKIDDTVSGKKSMRDAWLDYHWAGGDDNPDRPARKHHWDSEMQSWETKIGGLNDGGEWGDSEQDGAQDKIANVPPLAGVREEAQAEEQVAQTRPPVDGEAGQSS